ncbi:MAG: hypothetical protein WD532_04775 [Acidimicrobiia bacterium]
MLREEAGERLKLARLARNPRVGEVRSDRRGPNDILDVASVAFRTPPTMRRA